MNEAEVNREGKEPKGNETERSAEPIAAIADPVTELAEETPAVEQTGNAEQLQATIASILHKLDDIAAKQDELESRFTSKLQYDAHKEKLIDTLHRELQQYRNDLVQKLLQPVILDLIANADSARKQISNLQHANTLEPAEYLKIIASFPEDLDDILYRQGAEAYITEIGQPYTANRHRILESIPTGDQTQNKTIAQSIKRGYLWQEKIIRPELVNVFVYKEPQSVQEAADNE